MTADKNAAYHMTALFAENASALPAHSCHPLLLTEGNGWLVRCGKVNIFAAIKQENSILSQRVFVAEIGAGEIIFPASPFECKEPKKICLLAESLPGTEIIPLQTAWHELLHAVEPETSAFIRAALYTWIEKFSLALATGSVPRDCRLVTLDNLTTTLTRSYLPGESFRSEHDLIWVKITEGYASLCGNEENTLLVAECEFPLSRRLWVTCWDNTVVDFLPFDQIMADSRAHARLTAFYELFCRTFLLTRTYFLSHEHDKRNQQLKLERLAMAASVERLAALNDHAASTIAPPGNASVNPVISALQIIMQAAEVPFTYTGKIPENYSGASLLSNILEHAAIYYRQVTLSGDWWKKASVGMVGFLNEDQTPVGLVSDREQGYKFYDPRDARWVILNAKTAELISPTAFCLYPQLPDRPVTLKTIATFTLRTLKPTIALILVIGILDSLLGLVSPYAVGIIFGSIIPYADIFQLCQLTVIMVVAAITSTVFSLSTAIAVLKVRNISDYNLQAAVIGRLLRLPLALLQKYSTGDMVRRVMGVDTMRETLTEHVTAAVLGLFIALPNLGLLCWYSWKMALCGFLLVILFSLFMVAMGIMNCTNQKNYMRVSGELSGMLLQIISGITKIRHSVSENRAFIRWSEMFEQETRWYIRKVKNINTVIVFDAFFPPFVCMLFFYLIGSHWKNELTLGEYLAANAAFAAFLTAMTSFSQIIPSLASLIPVYQRLEPILREQPESDETMKSPGQLDGKLEIKRLSFRYAPDGPMVIDDLNIAAAPGEFIAIVGSSGAGKSTVVRMLLGFATPESGGIYFSGQDITTINKRELRKQIGVVLQNDSLFEGSILQNIIGMTNLPPEEAWAAARMAGCARDIEAMPMGIHTLVNNHIVSGGQKQRILIARALVHKPRIIIFDEATSAVDNETQAHISEALRQLNATRIVVAHRLSTIKNADRIYVMEHGRVVQCGTFSQLLATPGRFRTLAERQMV